MSGSFLFIHVNEWASIDSPDSIPISCGYILANLKKHGFDGAILGDYAGSPLSPQVLAAAIKKLQPAVLGFSVYEENIDRVRVLASFAKHVKNDLLVVLGGPQVTFMPGNALLHMEEVDVLCRGEGEVVMVDIARALAAGADLATVHGICIARDGMVLEMPESRMTPDLDEYPSPYLDGTVDPNGKERVLLFTSRGCTSPCTFCYTTRASRKKVRFHSIERTVAEMTFLQQKGINDFWFADPNFAYSRERLELLLRMIRDRVPGAAFWCQTRYDLVDNELLELLKSAGAHTIAFGLESAHRPVLKKIRKGLDPDRMSKAIHLARQAGINVELFTQFGLPGETLESALKTLAFVKKNGVAVDGNSISQQMHLFFGTGISDKPAVHGIRPHNITRPYYQSICRDFRTDSMSDDDIRSMSVIWRIHRRDFNEDVEHGRNLFKIAGFVCGNRKHLNGCHESEILLARIYLALDEPEAAASCLKKLQETAVDDPEVCRFIRESLTGFRSIRRMRARQGCRIIFDCRGRLDGREVAETVCRYKDVVLGRGLLLDDFEKGMDGLKAGSTAQFDVRFPEDYGNRKLAGRKVTFQVFLYQVLEPVSFGSVEEMLEQSRRNMYRFDDLIGLSQHNENLYYMVLRDSVLHSYTGNLTHIVALFTYCLKLGFYDRAMDIAYMLPDEPSVNGHIGRILLVNNYVDEALDFLERAAGTSGEIEQQRIKAYMLRKDYHKAEELAAHPFLTTSLETMNYRVQLAALMQLPVEKYLGRMNRLLDAQVKMMAAQVADS